MVGLISIVLLGIVILWIYNNSKKGIKAYQLPKGTGKLLSDNVRFYRELSAADKLVFEARIADFLANTTVRGVDVAVEELDKLLVASGAIILIFSFPDWRYNNISEVLLYKGTFNHEFETDGANRRVLGMVGDGALHRQMLLSRPSLRAAFKNETDGHNVVMHEFAHLIDKADGAIDGVPEYLLTHPQVGPWVREIRDNINDIRRRGQSDIDGYAATNDAEFFAVITEYFFERPDKLQDKHPELYAQLQQMFHPKQGGK